MSIELRGGVRASAVIGDSAFARQAARFLPDTRSRAVSAFDIQQKARLEEADGLDGAREPGTDRCGQRRAIARQW